MLRCLGFILVAAVSVACKQSHVQEEKNFQVFIDSENEELRDTVAVLIQDYNLKAGSSVLSIAASAEEANSTIQFQDDLLADGRKLGLGLWKTVQKVKSEGVVEQSSVVTVEYGMELTFDKGNFLNKAAFIHDKNSDEYKHLFHLFAHEVGHGMQLEHSDDIHNVMYPSIPETYDQRNVNYWNYFHTIRNFLGLEKMQGQEPEQTPVRGETRHQDNVKHYEL